MTTDKEALDRVIRARTVLILDHPFFGALALRLRIVEENSIPTCATDGKSLYYNTTFVKSLTNEELQGVVAHEVLHCTNGHPWREGARDHQKWNYAADYAINPIITEAGMTLPENALLDAQYAGKSAEDIYNRLPDSLKGGRSCGMGEVMAPPSGGDKAEGEGEGAGNGTEGGLASEGDWQVAAVQSANAAKMMGKLPGSLERLIDSITNPKVNWKAALQNIIQQSLCRDDYSWVMPNNRYLSGGLYMPSLRSESVPPIVVVVDTSGSIGARELNAFASEITAIAAQTKPEKIYVVFVDAAVQEVQEFLPGETIELTPKGGGGTDMPKAFEWIEEQGLDPAVCIFLTDGYTPFGEPQDYPVVWTITNESIEAPHGTTIFMNINETDPQE